jgi:hypothetical protein
MAAKERKFMSLLPHCNVTVKNLVQSITGRNTHHNRFKQNLKKHPLRADDSDRSKRLASAADRSTPHRKRSYKADI